MQTTLLGLAIAFIIALVAALVGPHFIDWNQFRPQFEAEATRVIGAPVRVAGELDARLLPTPSLRLRSVTVGGANDLGKIGANKLDVEFSLGDLMRGEWRANELTIDGMAVDIGLDPQGRIDLPAANGALNLKLLAIDRLNLTGRIALHDAASRRTLELNDIAFSGDVRSLAGSVRGDGGFAIEGTRYPFRISSGQTTDGVGTRLHFSIDPGERPLAADLDGVLNFESRAPRFEGLITLAVPPTPKSKGGSPSQTPWKISAKIKADPASARLEQVEASYGPEDTALRASGVADVRFGASPRLRSALFARQLDADKLAKDNGGEPVRLLPRLHAFAAAVPQPPIPAEIEFSAEQIMLGGRPLQNLAAELHADTKVWMVDRLDVRAPGATHVVLNGSAAGPGTSGSLAGGLEIESSDPDALLGWLQGRTEIVRRSQKPLRLSGNVELLADHVAMDGLKAEIDGGTVEGRITVFNQTADGGPRVEAMLKSDRLDLDAAGAFARSLAGPQSDWPDHAVLSLDVGSAVSAGQEFRPLAATLAYSSNKVSLDRLKIGGAGGVTVQGTGSFDRADATGNLVLDSSAASLGPLTAMIAPLAPALVSRFEGVGAIPGPANLKFTLDVSKNAEHADHAIARAALDISTPSLKGVTTITANPEIAAIRDLDFDGLRRGDISIESKLSSERGRPLLSLLALDRVVGVGEGPARFEALVSGAWQAPLRVSAAIIGAGLYADVQGTAEPWTTQPKAAVNLRIRHINLAPLFGLKQSDALAQDISLSSRVSLAGDRLTFDDLDSAAFGSRLRGHLRLMLGEEKTADGEIGLDSVDLAPVFELAIGAAGRNPEEPLGPGLLKGWRGRVAFQALRGALPGGGELRPVSGTIRSDGQSLTFDSIKGGIGGGTTNANIDARRTADGIALNARVELSGVDGRALQYRSLKMPSGRASMQMTMVTQGRSISALAGALSGNGTVTLESAAIAGLDPRAFEVAIRASDSGQATDDARLRQIVEPALWSGALSVPSAQIPFTIRDGRLRIGATTLDAQGARAIVSGGYDIPADQADIRASVASTTTGSASSRPEIQLFAAGPPDALNPSIDVTALSSWLAVRTIDRETRRLDAIERGEAPPSAAALPLPALPGSTLEPPLPGREPHRFQPKPKPMIPLRPAGAAAAPAPPLVSQHVAPLPPPIEVRPAPAPAPVKPKPRPPLMLVPPSLNP